MTERLDVEELRASNERRIAQLSQAFYTAAALLTEQEIRMDGLRRQIVTLDNLAADFKLPNGVDEELADDWQRILVLVSEMHSALFCDFEE